MDRIVIKVNSVCNLACEYCFYKEKEQRMLQRKRQSREKVNYFLESIEKNASIKSVVITGGEPTLYPNIEKLLKCFTNKNVTILTNGVRRLKGCNLDNVRMVISLDGDYKIMRKQRNILMEDFDKIIHNVIYYIKKSQHVDISTLVTEFNLKEREYYPFKKFGIECSYSFNVPSKIFTPYAFLISNEEYSKVLEWILSIEEKNDFRLNASVGIIPTSYVKKNLEQVIDEIYIVEYDMEKNNFSVFNYAYTNLDDLIKDERIIKGRLQKILQNKIEHYNCEYINPYNEIEEYIYKRSVKG